MINVWDTVLYLSTPIGCFCPRTFFLNDGILDNLPWTSSISDSHIILRIISTTVPGVATDSPWSVWGRVWTDHLPPVWWSTFKLMFSKWNLVSNLVPFYRALFHYACNVVTTWQCCQWLKFRRNEGISVLVNQTTIDPANKAWNIYRFRECTAVSKIRKKYLQVWRASYCRALWSFQMFAGPLNFIY